MAKNWKASLWLGWNAFAVEVRAMDAILTHKQFSHMVRFLKFITRGGRMYGFAIQ
jgi:hypothetical protein